MITTIRSKILYYPFMPTHIFEGANMAYAYTNEAKKADNKPAKGDTVQINAVVSHVSSDGSLSFRTVENKWGFSVDRYTVEDVKVTKKAPAPQPPAGSVVKLTSKYGSEYKYVIKKDGSMYAINTDGSVDAGSYVKWDSFNHDNYTITVL